MDIMALDQLEKPMDISDFAHFEAKSLLFDLAYETLRIFVDSKVISPRITSHVGTCRKRITVNIEKGKEIQQSSEIETSRLHEVLPQCDSEVTDNDCDGHKLWSFLPLPSWQWLYDHEYSVPAKTYPFRRRNSSGLGKKRLGQ